MIIDKIKQILNLNIMKIRWKQTNKNNGTYIMKDCDISKIVVGDKSYGPLEVYCWGNSNERLEIGKYVSIANDVKFVLGGNHKYNLLSTYPFNLNSNIECYSNGPIILEDDVWVGMNSIIMSGIRVGRGSIIAAGSVVVKDVLPYSIVGGNPAKIIKFRFNNEIIEKLKMLDFNSIDKKFIEENKELLYTELDNEVLEKIMSKII